MPSSQGRIPSMLEALKFRYSYREITKIVKDQTAVSLSGGWNSAVEKLKELDAATLVKVDRLLQQLCSDLVLAGTKDVFIFELDAIEAESIRSAFSSLVLEPSPYSLAYPLSLSESDLNLRTTDHELAYRHEIPNGDVSLVFCTRRSQEDRTTYEYSETAPAVQEAFAGYHEFIAIRRLEYQIFDVVTLRPRLLRLEVLIDHPSRISRPHTSNARCQAVLGRLSTLVPELAAIYEANSPINLAACVSGLYHASTEGRVSQLGFRAPTGSRNKSSIANEDLRKELFHEKGVEAVGDVSPYDVTITWDTLTNVHGSVGVQVGMPISNLTVEGSQIDHARIIDASSDSAVIAVVNKLVSYST